MTQKMSSWSEKTPTRRGIYILDRELGVRLSAYEAGYKYCKCCEIWFKTKRVWCERCNRRMRATPRKGFYKRRMIMLKKKRNLLSLGYCPQ